MKPKLIAEPNIWHANEKNGIWEYGNYRRCYLMIMTNKEGKYIPTVNGGSNIEYPGTTLNDKKRMEFNTLEDAKNHCFKYVDYIRDVYDLKALNLIRSNLKTALPHVYV